MVAQSPDELIPPLKTIGIVELLHTEYPPIKWIIPDVLPEGLTLLFSRPKVGKSMMALALSLRIARRTSGGVDGETLYLSLDDTSPRRLQSRVRSLLQGEEVEDKVHIAFESKALDTGLITQLRMWMQAHPTTALIVVDVFGAVKPRHKDDDVYKHDYETLKALREFAEQQHVAVLLVHHTKKRVDTEDWINNVNGSTGLVGAVDTIWMLKRDRGSSRMELLMTGRDVEDQTLTLWLEDLDAPWRIQGDEFFDESATSATETKILNLFSEERVALSPKVIVKELDGKPGSIRRLLCRLVEKGMLKHATYGSYELQQSATSATNICNEKVCRTSEETTLGPAQEAEFQSTAKCDKCDNIVTLPQTESFVDALTGELITVNLDKPQTAPIPLPPRRPTMAICRNCHEHAAWRLFQQTWICEHCRAYAPGEKERVTHASIPQ